MLKPLSKLLKNHPLAIVLVLACMVNGAALVVWGVSTEVESDAKYFLGIAQNLADGNGYKNPYNYWPNQPTMDRAPGWPVLEAVALKITPGNIASHTIARVLAVLINISNPVLICLLSIIILKKPILSIISGGLYVLHPTALYTTLNALSEPAFVLLLVAGTILVLRKTERQYLPVLGAFLLGLACLIRPNFILFPFVLFGVWFIWRLFHLPDTGGIDRKKIGGVLASFAVFLAPTSFWMLRNYKVSNEFPIISTLMGQTLYGGNNEIVANDLDVWGHWIFPDKIPDTPSMHSLTETMNEQEINTYYAERGKKYIFSHWRTMPRLLLGKLIRAYGLVPWTAGTTNYLVALFRSGLYLLGTIGVLWLNIDKSKLNLFCLLLASMILVNIATVLIFWGSPRFAFAIEPILCVLAGFGIVRTAEFIYKQWIPHELCNAGQ